MGCTGSVPKDHEEYLREIEELRLQLKNQKERSHEEENLLRFKVEVLVNMLTVEEQRCEISTKRLETLKWLVSTSSDLESVRHLIHSTNDSEIFSHIQPLNAELGEAIEIMRKDFIEFREDLFMALATEDGHIVSSLPKLEFMKQVYGATENVQKSELQLIAARFDDGNGSVNVPEFLDFFCTPHTLRTAKSAANAVRMSLDMLTLNDTVYTHVQPDEVDDVDTRRSHFTNRLDRSAKRLLAVWMFVRDELISSFSVLKETRNLSRNNSFKITGSNGSGKDNAINNTAKVTKKKAESDDVVKVAIFERSLMEICGKNAFFMVRLAANTSMCETLYNAAYKTVKHRYSGKKDDDKENKDKNAQEKKSSERSAVDDENNDDDDEEDSDEDESSVPPFPSDRLEAEDAVMLARRFELMGLVHIEGFVSFFDEAFLRTQSFTVRGMPIRYDAAITGISPFRWSTEWTDLKQTSVLRQSQQHSLPSPPPKPQEPPVPKAPAKAPEPPKEPEKQPETPKPAPVKPAPAPAPVAEPKTPATPAPAVVEEKKPAEEKKATAPVAEPAGAACGCCGGSKAKPATNTPAEAKRKPQDPPTPLPARQESKPIVYDDDEDADAKPAAKETKDDDKHEEKKTRDEVLPTLKPSEEFETPPKPKPTLINRNGFLPDRDGLGHEDEARRARLNADLGGVPTPIGNNAAAAAAPAAAGARRRLRRHEDRDFTHEGSSNPLDKDSDEEMDGGAVRFNAPRSRGGR